LDFFLFAKVSIILELSAIKKRKTVQKQGEAFIDIKNKMTTFAPIKWKTDN